MSASALHHLGVAVVDLAEAVERYRGLLGAEVVAREELPEQGVSAVALRVGSGRVELMAPLAADTPVGRFLERRGPGMHHVAYAVGDLQAELDRLRRDGRPLVDERPREGLYGRVAFLHPDAALGVLVELVESDEGE